MTTRIGMSRLVSIIGPAPSEASTEELLERIRTERSRVRRGLLAFRQGSKTKTSKAAKKVAKRIAKSDKAKFTALAKRMGMSLEQFKDHMKEKGIDIDKL